MHEHFSLLKSAHDIQIYFFMSFFLVKKWLKIYIFIISIDFDLLKS